MRLINEDGDSYEGGDGEPAEEYPLARFGQGEFERRIMPRDVIAPARPDPSPRKRIAVPEWPIFLDQRAAAWLCGVLLFLGAAAGIVGTAAVFYLRR